MTAWPRKPSPSTTTRGTGNDPVQSGVAHSGGAFVAVTPRISDVHGDRCTCRLLAAAVGCDIKTIPFSYCRSVLMKRWAMTCNHGCRGGSVEARAGRHMAGGGPIDTVKAILIKNE